MLTLLILLGPTLAVGDAQIGERAYRVLRPLDGLQLSYRLSRLPGASAVPARDRRFRADFTTGGSLLQTLRKTNSLPLFRVLDNSNHKLFIGVHRDGTLGVHFSFRD